jgi:hypothetical protein
MEWTADVTVGEWLRARTDDPWRATIHDVVPKGFEAYARVFHPATRSRPVGRPWPPFPVERNRRAWQDFSDTRPEIETRPARWQDAAAAFGTTMHPLAQWNALVRAGDTEPGQVSHAISPDGWEFDPPILGDLDADVLAAVVARLLGRGEDATAGYAAVWSGWGGLLGHVGTTPLAYPAGDDPEQRRLHDTLAHSITDPFNRPYATETWQPGILPDDVSRGTLLELPAREHVLFHGDLRVFTDSRWPLRVPWRDPELQDAGFDRVAQSPSILWPRDLTWVVVTEVDWDSTVVGGSAARIAELCRVPEVEALPLPAGSSLQWDADGVNR